jgi:hypothetical protein
MAGFFVSKSTRYASLAVGNYGSPLNEVFNASDGGSQGCIIYGDGDLACSGTTTAVVPAGAQKVSVYATESTENWFEDAGGGQLVGGVAHIDLDPTFALTVNTTVSYRVFLTPGGECKGLYVSQKSATSFEVRELGGGTSNIAFDYRIMAKRNGFENVRLADVTQKYQETEQRRKALRERASQH